MLLQVTLLTLNLLPSCMPQLADGSPPSRWPVSCLLLSVRWTAFRMLVDSSAPFSIAMIPLSTLQSLLPHSRRCVAMQT